MTPSDEHLRGLNLLSGGGVKTTANTWFDNKNA